MAYPRFTAIRDAAGPNRVSNGRVALTASAAARACIHRHHVTCEYEDGKSCLRRGVCVTGVFCTDET